MAFCTACGNPVADNDTFCGTCGAKQQPRSTATGYRPPQTGTHPDFTTRVSDRKAALFCYLPIIGWVWAIIVLASHRFRSNRTMRFHAFQGLYLFATWLLVDWVISPMFRWGPDSGLFFFHFTIGKLLHLAVFVAWIFMLVKTANNETFRLPIIGELAEKSVAEQR